MNAMRNRLLLLLICMGLLSLGTNPRVPLSPPGAAEAAPGVFSSPINAGCIQTAPTECKLHIDPFTIQVAPGNRLAAFELRANGSLLYDFRTDVSNPPPGNYTPSLVRQDYGVSCGAVYTVNLLARDSGDPNLLNAGQAENITCPAASYTLMLPLVLRD